VGLAALLARRAQGLSAEEGVPVRLERAVLLAGPLGDRALAKRELRELLTIDANNRVAIATLADLELEDGEAAVAAELSVRQAALDDDPARLVACFLRLGRIYQGPLADIKQAVSAFEGVVDLQPDNREALLALSELYARAGEASRGVAVTERLLDVEADPTHRRTLLIRLANLWEQSGDVRRAGIALRHAAGEAPRDLSVIGELVHFHDRHKDLAARNVLLDGAIALGREDVRTGREPMTALRTLIPLFRWRERPASALAAAQLLARLTSEPSERAELATFIGKAARPGAGRPGPLAGLSDDERALPRELPPGLTHVLRVLGPSLSRASKPDLKRFQVGRPERQGRATELRLAFDGLATELGLRDFEIYLSSAIPQALSVEPGDPPAFVLGAGVVAMGPSAVRFAAGFLTRLTVSHFSLLLRDGPIEAAALVAGLVRQFRPDHRPPYLPEAALREAEARLSRAMTRAMRTELAPLAVQLAAGVSPEELFTAAQEVAARGGLLACGDVGVALDVLAAYAGRKGAPLGGMLQVPLVAQLIDFALSEEYDGLIGAGAGTNAGPLGGGQRA
jgi:tetratricopeptide (TPR) repeat protein